MKQMPDWKIRRRVVNATLIFCALVIVYLLVYGTDSNLNNTIANGILFLAGSVVVGYVFGETWSDKNSLTNRHRYTNQEDDNDNWRN
jgi:hypothetical protein